MATIRYIKRYNKWYVYEVSQYWDKELKKPRQHSKYLGIASEKGGKYNKPGKKVITIEKIITAKPPIENAIIDCGDSYAINETSKKIGLSKVIEDSFDNLDSIMALVCFQITEGSAMYNCENWIEGNIAKKLFPHAKIGSQDISKLIKILGEQNLQIKFFKNYIAKFFPEERGVLIDSTALPSAINSSINAFGYANGNIEQNVTCLMLVDQKSKLPIYFRAIGGDIADVSTVKSTVDEIRKLGLEANSAILDAGFCSKENLNFLCDEKINFITRLPKSHAVFHELVEKAGNMELRKNAVIYGDRAVFIKSKKIKIYGHEMHAHVILDPNKKGKDISAALRNSLDNKISKEYRKELNLKMKNAGFFILLSSVEIGKADILPSYYARQSIEQVFGFAKTNNSILPLRVHSEQSIKGYLMLVFLALVVFISMRQKLKLPMDKNLFTLRNLKAKIFDDEIIIQEANKKTKDVFKELGIPVPTTIKN